MSRSANSRDRWLASVALAMLCLSCAGEPDVPHIVLISVDSLRPDHLTAYGYDRDTDIPLEDLFADSVIFDNAISTSSWTAPAVASLISGLIPQQHGVSKGRIEGVKSEQPMMVDNQPVLPDEISTLAEHLAARGYATLGVSTNPHVTRELGFAQGFEHFESVGTGNPDPSSAFVHADAGRANAAALRLRAAARSNQPIFLWVHYIDPHNPYFARQPWFDSYVGTLLGELPRGLPPSVRSEKSIRGKRFDLGEKRTLLEAYYDSEVRFTMQHISELMKELALGEDTIFVLTSDHGEAFFEHGYLGHSVYLYESEIRIPLLIRFPSAGPAARRVPDYVSIVDVMPTLLDYIDMPLQSPVQGRSLLPLARGGADPTPVPLFGGLSRREKRNYSFVQQGRFKLIRHHKENKNRLIDLETDEIEFNDSGGKFPLVKKALMQMLTDRTPNPDFMTPAPRRASKPRR